MAAVLTRQLRSRVETISDNSLSLILQGVTLYLIAFAVLAILLFATPAFLSTDDYYHARAAEQIIVQGRLDLDFPWLPMTILSPERYVNHHLLFHMWLAPFVYFMDDMTGAKIGTIAIAAGIFVAAWALLRGVGVRYPVIWALGLFGMSSTFIFRMLMIRVPVGGVLFLILVLHVLFQRRYKWLIPLSFLFTWLYSSGVIVLLGSFIFCYMAGTWVTERKIAWKAPVYVGIGMLLGFVINPFFPKNIAFIAENLLPKVDLENSVPVGAEWYPLESRVLMSIATGALVALFVGVLRPSLGGRRMDRVDTTLLFASILTLLMVFNSMRFLEYFPPFALLFCAVSWGRDDWVLNWHPLRGYGRLLAPLVLIAVLGFFSVRTIDYTYRMSVASRNPAEFAGAAAWLKNNTPPGTLVMSTGFNDFSRLFFYNQSNYYVIGLDPTYLSLVSQEMWDQYYAITQGNVENPSQPLTSVFGSQYVVSGRGYRFETRAGQDPNMELVFRDDFNSVWKVRDEYFNQAR